MARRNRIRSLRRHQELCRLAWLNQAIHEIAVLEGRLAPRLGVGPDRVADHLGISDLPPWERLDALLKAAAEYGV